jgi:hypothetical protein
MSALRSRNKRTRPGKPAPILIELHRPAAPPGKLKCIGGSRSDTWNLQLANQVVATLGLRNSDEEDSQSAGMARSTPSSGSAPEMSLRE